VRHKVLIEQKGHTLSTRVAKLRKCGIEKFPLHPERLFALLLADMRQLGLLSHVSV
jgi:hypothetical protein